MNKVEGVFRECSNRLLWIHEENINSSIVVKEFINNDNKNKKKNKNISYFALLGLAGFLWLGMGVASAEQEQEEEHQAQTLEIEPQYHGGSLPPGYLYEAFPIDRFVASAIDFFLLSLPFFPYRILGNFFRIAFLIGIWGGQIYCYTKSTSLGKYLFGMCVVNKVGVRVTLIRMVVHDIVKYFGLMFALFDAWCYPFYNTFFHNWVAGTYVVYE